MFLIFINFLIKITSLDSQNYSLKQFSEFYLKFLIIIHDYLVFDVTDHTRTAPVSSNSPFIVPNFFRLESIKVNVIPKNYNTKRATKIHVILPVLTRKKKLKIQPSSRFKRGVSNPSLVKNTPDEKFTFLFSFHFFFFRVARFSRECDRVEWIRCFVLESVFILLS